MWRLREFRIEKLLGVARAAVEVREPVVVLAGPMRSGKTTTLAGISVALTGSAIGPDGKSLDVAEIKNPAWGNDGWAAVVLEDDAGQQFAVGREFLSSTAVNLNGERVRTLGEAKTRITEALGATPEQLMWLMGGGSLIWASPQEQSAMLGNTLGVTVGFDDLLERLNGHADLGREVLAPVANLTGWELLSRATVVARDARLEKNRAVADAKAVASSVDVDEVLAAAGVIDVSGLADAQGRAGREVASAQTRLEKLQAAQAQREQVMAARAAAQKDLDEAEAEVAALRDQVAGADEARAEREAERETLKAAVDEARADLTAAEEALATAAAAVQDKHATADAALDALESARESGRILRARLPKSLCCPGCGVNVALVDGALCAMDDLPDGVTTQAQVEAAEAAEQAAEEALVAAKQAVDKVEVAENDAGARVDEAEAVVLKAAAALAACPELPAAADLQARLEAAVAASDKAAGRLAEAQAQELPNEVTPEQIAAAREAIELARERVSSIERATEVVARQGSAAVQRREAEEEHARYDALVTRLGEVARELASAMSDPVTEAVSALLGRTVVFDEAVGLGTKLALPGGEEYVRPLRMGSTGERLLASAALEVVLARALGVGVVLIDELSGLDDDTAQMTLSTLVEWAEADGMTMVVTTAQALPGHGRRADEWPIEGVQVVAVGGGRTDPAAAPIEVPDEVAVAK